MGWLIAQFAFTAVVVLLAGVFLTRYADVLGEKTGLGRTLAGMILLASATSLPELVVDVTAVRLERPNPDLALGDLLGSCLMNLLILAVLDMLHRSRARVFSPAAAAHAISATMSIVLICICLIALQLQTQFEILHLGPGSLAILVCYLLGLRLVYHDQRMAAQQLPPEGAVPGAERMSWLVAVGGFSTAAAVILFAAPHLAHLADELADRTGLGGTFVGTTLVALTTSLPEMVTTLAALRAGATDLAVGNILGSNSFNMFIVPIVDFAFDGPLFAAVAPQHGLTAACVILITAVAMLSLLNRAEKRWWFIEPDAALIIVLVLAAIGMLYAVRPA